VDFSRLENEIDRFQRMGSTEPFIKPFEGEKRRGLIRRAFRVVTVTLDRVLVR
jgi:hypothetical protein